MKLNFLKPKDLINPDDKVKWCKKLHQNTCSKLCLHRKLQKSKKQSYNETYKYTCVNCNIREVSYDYKKV